MEDSATLQKVLDSLTQWIETWLLRLNIGKCKAISYSRRPELNTNYSISGVTVENENMKDLGITSKSLATHGAIQICFVLID